MTHDSHTATSPPRGDQHRDRGHASPKGGPSEQHHARHAYLRLALMAGLSFVTMYVLMYAMVDRVANIRANLNQAYMPALMAAPMVAIELALMRSMYRDFKLNLATLGLSGAVFIGAFLGVREQAAVGDAEFLRSMIPHHSRAIHVPPSTDLRSRDSRTLPRYHRQSAG